jgi:Domain of Unknown Function (DUF748)
VRPIVRRSLLCVAVVVALYGSLGRWGAAYLIDRSITRYALAHGHSARVGAIVCNPFTGSVEIRNLSLTPSGGTENLLVGTLTLQLGWRTLFGRTTELRSFRADTVSARLTRRPDGQWDLGDLLPRTDPTAPWPAVRVGHGLVHVKRLIVLDARHGTAPLWDLKDATLRVDPFDTAAASSTWHLVVQTDRDERLTATTELSLTPLQAHVAFEIQRLDLSRIGTWVDRTVPRTQGRLSAHGLLEWSADHPTRLALRRTDVAGDSLQVWLPGTQTPSVAVPQWSVSALEYDTGSGAVGFAGLALQAPRIAVATHELSDSVLAWATAGSDAPGPRPDVGRVTVSDGRIEVVDDRRSDPVRWLLETITLDLSPSRSEGRAVAAAAQVGRGHVQLAGRIGSSWDTAELAVTTQHLAVTQWDPYLRSLLALHIDSGWWSGDGQLTTDGHGWHYRGSATVDQLRTTDTGRQRDFLGVDRLQADGIDAHWPEIAIHVDRVSARAPYADVRFAADGQSNLAGLMPATAERANTPLPPISVDTMTIAEGRLYFADESQSPTFEAGIADLSGEMTGLSSDPTTRAHLAFTGHVDRYAPVSIDGDANLVADPIAAHVHMHFDNLELTGLSPYSGRFAGYRIRKGKASADLNYDVANHQVNATHRVRLQQFELGDRVEGQAGFGVPLGLVVALLKDGDGNIDLDVPLSGSFDDPNFNLGRLTQKVVGNLFRKIVTSPFALLGSLFGRGEEISLIEFQPGALQPQPDARARLQTLAQAMTARPQISVEVPIAATALDATALAAQRLNDILLTRAREQLGDRDDASLYAQMEASPTDRRRVLMAVLGLSASSADNAQLEAAARQATTPTADDLEQLATGRAQAIQASLIEGNGIDPGRVFLVRRPRALVKGNAVELQLALH